jgi:disease resistance protein RPM1
MVTEMYNLRYLDFSHTKVKHIPASFRKLINLQVLDLGFTYVQELPCEINSLLHLRHLHVCLNHALHARTVDCFSATKIPANICRLKNLQALWSIQANKNLVSHLGNMTLMRSLAVWV